MPDSSRNVDRLPHVLRKLEALQNPAFTKTSFHPETQAVAHRCLVIQEPRPEGGNRMQTKSK